MSALFDRENPPRHCQPADDNTAEIPLPTSADPHDPDLGYDPADAHRARLRPTTRLRRGWGVAVFCCYLVTLVSAAWLLIGAFLHLQALVMVLAVGVLVWLGPEARRLSRWLRADSGRPMPASRLAQLVAFVITALDLFLFVYALL